MDFLKQQLTEFLKKKSNIDLKGIKKGLQLTKEEGLLLEDCLLKMEIEGILYKDKYGQYSLLENKTSIMQGKVHFLSNKDAIVITNDNKQIIIPKNKTKGLIEKDIVTVKNIVADSKNNLYGVIDKIISRNQKQISCEVIFKDGENTLVKYNSKNDLEINVDKNSLKDYGAGEILLVKLEKNGPYDGKVIKYLGHKDEPDLDEKTIAYDHGFECEYSSKYLKELEKIPTKVDIDKALKEKRVDLRDKNIFTIDGKDTKDMDDAIGIELLDNGNYKLYVSIADVSYYIKDDTVIFNEAYKRATSVYMNDTVIPMFHPKISNGICSLHPNVDRLTKTCEIIIDKNGKVISYDIYDSIIHSKKKMTYEDVNEILINNNMVKGYEDFYNDLMLMNELSKKLDIIKDKRGYLNFYSKEIKAKGRNENITFEARIQKDAEKLIENFMLLANESVAEFMSYRSLPSIYRVHESPDEEKVREFITMLNGMGFNLKNCKNNITSNKYMQNLTNEILSVDNIDKEIFSELLLMNTMKRAKYSNYNLGHYGLALKNYTHFTSPIRRFADLQVHKLLNIYIKNYNLDYNELDKYLSEVARNCTERSLAADKAEKEASQMRMAEYMEGKIGEIFDGTITYIGSRNMKVKTQDGIIGSLNYSTMTDDNYIYDVKQNKLIGQNTNKEFKIGDPITIVVKNASKKSKTINFVMKGYELEKPKIKTHKKNKH